MSSPKQPEKPTEERIGEMIGKILFLALCAFLPDNIARSVTLALTRCKSSATFATLAAIRRASLRRAVCGVIEA
jgi:hypothetical protein